MRQDLLRVYAGSRVPTKPKQGRSYRRTHNELALRAKHVPVDRDWHRVTDFTAWVHLLYGYRSGTPEALRYTQPQRVGLSLTPAAEYFCNLMRHEYPRKTRAGGSNTRSRNHAVPTIK